MQDDYHTMDRDWWAICMATIPGKITNSSLNFRVRIADDAHELLQIVQQQNSGYRDKLQDIAGKLLYWSNNIEMLLDRHLADEEDLIVPIVIHHKIRG